MLRRQGGLRRASTVPSARSERHPQTQVDPATDGALRRDAERIRRAREGDEAAVSELYTEHRVVALRVASRHCRPADVDDVVAEAFVRVLAQIRSGGGPRTSFRAYLLTAVRHAAVDLARAESRISPAPIDDDLPARDAVTAPREDAGSDRQLESHVLAGALATLPGRWQLAIWWADVEGRPMGEIGARLGLNANAAAALAFRAREGLRDAYLAQHLDRTTDPACRRWRPQLPALVRGRVSGRAVERLSAHLDACAACREALSRLHAVRAQHVG